MLIRKGEPGRDIDIDEEVTKKALKLMSQHGDEGHEFKKENIVNAIKSVSSNKKSSRVKFLNEMIEKVNELTEQVAAITPEEAEELVEKANELYNERSKAEREKKIPAKTMSNMIGLGKIGSTNSHLAGSVSKTMKKQGEVCISFLAS